VAQINISLLDVKRERRTLTSEPSFILHTFFTHKEEKMSIIRLLVCPVDKRVWGCYRRKKNFLMLCKDCEGCDYGKSVIEPLATPVPVLKTTCPDCWHKGERNSYD